MNLYSLRDVNRDIDIDKIETRVLGREVRVEIADDVVIDSDISTSRSTDYKRKTKLRMLPEPTRDQLDLTINKKYEKSKIIAKSVYHGKK